MLDDEIKCDDVPILVDTGPESGLLAEEIRSSENHDFYTGLTYKLKSMPCEKYEEEPKGAEKIMGNGEGRHQY
jgi:hypothetical protein